MKYCHKCGREISLGSKFCQFCGGQQAKLKQEKKSEKRDSYFISHWKFFFRILGPAFVHSLLYALFIVIGIFVIEIIAAIFGYCITTSDHECMKLGYASILFGFVYFIYGNFLVLWRAIIVISQSFELKSLLGLLNHTKNFREYFTSRGIHTLFIPKYLLLIVVFLLSLIFGKDLATVLINTSIVLLLSDLTFLRWLFIKLLKLDEQQEDNLKKIENEVHDGVKNSATEVKSVSTHVKGILKVLLIVIALGVVSVLLTL